MIIQKKLLTGVTIATLLMNAVVPMAFADSTTEVSGNGAFSDNTVRNTQTNTSTTVQTNDANIQNHIDSNSNTGNNSADFNTGGDVRIDTGNALSGVSVTNAANANIADTGSCNTCSGNTQVLESGNGAYSRNDVSTSQKSNQSLFQTNNANFQNDINSNANTGNNSADFNTGGSTLVVTGHAATDTTVNNAANVNSATIGGSGNTGNGDILAKISGNGAFSDNAIRLANRNTNSLVQNNSADIQNSIDAQANTGYNSADYNTGSDTLIDTGNATTQERVNNLANFNAADLGCGCDMTLTEKILGNGAYSNSDIRSLLANNAQTFQTGNGDLYNNLHDNSSTGYNSVNYGASQIGGLGFYDPGIITGHAQDSKTVTNMTNANVFGPQAGLNLPGNLHLNLMFNMQDLLGLLNG